MTYDLAIAKVAMQLQAEEKPTYDNVFIHLGPFHITCAFFFSVLEKYLEQSGEPHILNETHVIEKGSLKSFLSGKSYNQQMQKISSITWSSKGRFTCPGLCRSL